jgi:hypothetical protein
MSAQSNTFAEELRADERRHAEQLASRSRVVPYFYRGTFLIDPFAGNGTQEAQTELEREICAFEEWAAR